MRAFYESLRYAFLMIFVQHTSDITAVTVLKCNIFLRYSFLII